MILSFSAPYRSTNSNHRSAQYKLGTKPTSSTIFYVWSQLNSLSIVPDAGFHFHRSFLTALTDGWFFLPQMKRPMPDGPVAHLSAIDRCKTTFKILSSSPRENQNHSENWDWIFPISFIWQNWSRVPRSSFPGIDRAKLCPKLGSSIEKEDFYPPEPIILNHFRVHILTHLRIRSRSQLYSIVFLFTFVFTFISHSISRYPAFYPFSPFFPALTWFSFKLFTDKSSLLLPGNPFQAPMFMNGRPFRLGRIAPQDIQICRTVFSGPWDQKAMPERRR